MIKITDFKVPLSYDKELLKDMAAGRLNINKENILELNIEKRSVDTSDKGDIHFKMNLTLVLSTDEESITWRNRRKGVAKVDKSVYGVIKNRKLQNRPVVVGCGPAGMFAALILAEAGERPILLERGSDIDSRKRIVSDFWNTGNLDTSTNVQFGEGGAGAFSDGKLKTGFKDARKLKILNEFINAGAPPEIMYLAKPHIGTDRLAEAVKGIRKKTISLGGEVRFDTELTEVMYSDGQVTGVGFMKNGEYGEITTDNVVLAIGHSARDTFESLFKNGIHMEQKNIAVGVRIEHPQRLIDRIQYGTFAGHPALGAADYKMVVHLKNGKGIYTFCMCPGGSVVSSTSEKNTIVTNGMSEYARDGRNANSALLVTIDKNEIGSQHPLAAMLYQRSIEEAAYRAGGGGYKAPVQRLEDFLNKKRSISFGNVLPTYRPGTEFSEVDSYLPAYVSESLRQAIYEMEDWMPGYAYPDAVLTGAETRSASPVRITRDDKCEAIGIKGLYPCGEGAGYAGGIISAAADGMICAEHILKRNS